MCGGTTHLLIIWGLDEYVQLVLTGQPGLPQVIIDIYGEATLATQHTLLQPITLSLLRKYS